jgi:hypothetical protein
MAPAMVSTSSLQAFHVGKEREEERESAAAMPGESRQRDSPCERVLPLPRAPIFVSLPVRVPLLLGCRGPAAFYSASDS